jgi:hypothetical protein
MVWLVSSSDFAFLLVFTVSHRLHSSAGGKRCACRTASLCTRRRRSLQPASDRRRWSFTHLSKQVTAVPVHLMITRLFSYVVYFLTIPSLQPCSTVPPAFISFNLPSYNLEAVVCSFKYAMTKSDAFSAIPRLA